MRGVARSRPLLLAIVGAACAAATAGFVSIRPSEGGAAPTARAAQVAVIETYPPQPRRVDGTPPAAALRGPRECAPSLDRGPERDYTPLSELRRRRADDPLVQGEPASYALTLVNRKRQRFTIYVSARAPSIALRYIARSTACMERFRVRALPPSLIKPVDLNLLLIDAAVRAAGVSQDELTELADDLTGTGPTQPAFVDVVTAAGADPDAVIADASAVAHTQLQARVSAGQLPASEVAGLDTEGLVRQLAEQPGAPFLFSPADHARTPAEKGAQLQEDRGRVSVSMEPARRLRRRTVVWFAFDPKIDKGNKHGYRARCEKESYAGIRAWQGGATVRFWRNPNPFIGTKTSWYYHNERRAMAHSSNTRRTYDIEVLGEANNSDYSAYGGWIQGAGGGC